MEKKNPYITTIGFNKDNPEHVQVAALLNGRGRGKAAYLVKAVLCYEAVKEREEYQLSGCGTEIDYGRLRNFVLQVIAEHEGRQIPELMVKEQDNEYRKNYSEAENKVERMGFDESTIEDIILSMEAFRR